MLQVVKTLKHPKSENYVILPVYMEEGPQNFSTVQMQLWKRNVVRHQDFHREVQEGKP